MHTEVRSPAVWELEPFWKAVARDVARPDPAELEAFRAADFPAPEPDPERLRELLFGAVALHPTRSYPFGKAL
jgi:hypothetical protein